MNSKQNRNVQCNEFYYDISAYGNLHASTASKCLVKIRKLIIRNLVFEACIERYCCTCTFIFAIYYGYEDVRQKSKSKRKKIQKMQNSLPRKLLYLQ
jgi:hypothetical protein